VGDFRGNLIVGQAGESSIANWLKARGWAVIPVYEKIMDTGKGPQVFTAEKSLVAPDLLIFNGEKAMWAEVKHKTAFAWHRISQRWTTGIDRSHYRHYLEVADMSPWPMWLMFLHRGGQAKDSPPNSPSGLFVNSMDYLRTHVNHEHDNHGRTGMVYWGIESLRLVASYNEVAGAG